MDCDTDFVFSIATHDTVIRVELLLIIGVSRFDVAMSDDLLTLFVAEHELGWRQEATEGDLAELLLFKELCNVHSHSQLLVSLLDLTEESHAPACDDLPETGARDSISGTQLGLDLEIEGLVLAFGLKLGREIEDVLYDVHFSFHFLI